MGRLTDWIFGPRSERSPKHQDGEWDIRLRTSVLGVDDFVVRTTVYQFGWIADFYGRRKGWVVKSWKDFPSNTQNLDDRKAEAVRWARAYISHYDTYTDVEHVEA